MKGYFKYIRPHILFFIFGPIFMITEVIGEVLMPRLLSLIIDSGIITGNMSGDSAYIIKIGISMVCVALMMMLGGVLGMLIMLALAYLGSVELLTPVNVLLYQLVWLLPGLLVTEWTRTV